LMIFARSGPRTIPSTSTRWCSSRRRTTTSCPSRPADRP
jgi:hypothetical protein